MDATENNLLYESDDESEVDLPKPEWNPNDDGICDESCDVFKKLFETNSDDSDEFDGFFYMNMKNFQFSILMMLNKNSFLAHSLFFHTNAFFI